MDFPYATYVNSLVHPERAAVIAHLFSLQPTAVNQARILELGCGDGSQLVALAETLPDTELIGLEHNVNHIDHANALKVYAKLNNIEFHQTDFLQINPDLGQFDYIIANNVLSWLPPASQNQFFAVCKQYLKSNGLILLNYNVYPGWNMRHIVRDMVQYHLSQFDDESKRQEQLRAILQFLQDTIKDSNAPYNKSLREEIATLMTLPNDFLQHELCAPACHPLYFHQFNALSHSHGLTYVGDVELHTMLASNMPEPAAEKLALLKDDMLRQEQFMDYVRNRYTRHSILSHADVAQRRALTADQLRDFYIVSMLKPDASSAANDTQHTFRAELGTVQTDNLLLQTTLQQLADAYPHPIHFNTLLQSVQNQAGTSNPEQDLVQLSGLLMHCYTRGLITLSLQPAVFTANVSTHPQVSTLLRYQVERHYAYVTNLRFESVRIDNPILTYLIPHLNGSNDHAALQQLLLNAVKRGDLVINLKINDASNTTISDDEQLTHIVPQLLTQTLEGMAAAALLKA